ncbi:MAG: hypothetical protein GEV12_01085 [Micromonosporaceae bacterium]|nr:hypothetical protein [Micromonosporaceae bacterium]
MRRAVTVLVVLGLVAGLGYWLGTRWDRSSPPAPRAGCRAEAASEIRLELEQMANAATIAAVGVRMEVPDRGVQIALATALQESKLRNLPHLGRRNDHDSVGLFQQRPSQGWGTEEQVGDPRYAAERFYRALRRVDGWPELRLTEAAQRVQRSAFPEAYQRWEPEAGVLATALLGAEPGVVSCTVPADPPERGQSAADALGEAMAQDWGTRVRTSPDAEPVGALRLTAGSAPGVAVAAGDPRTGWRYAHWLVAHAGVRGVTRVHFADLEWTAAAGGWSAAGSTSDQVWAEVATG